MMLPAGWRGGRRATTNGVLCGAIAWIVLTLLRTAAFADDTDSRPAGALSFEALQPFTNGLVVTIACPTSGPALLDLYSSDTLTAAAWRVEETLVPTGRIHRSRWTNAASERVRFFRLADAALDTDADELPDFRERWVHGTDPTRADTEGDGMGDGWEVRHHLDAHADDAADDPDGDGLTNLAEHQRRMNPRVDDTDGDGLKDGWEVAHGLDPLVDDTVADPDGDGWSNLQEFLRGGNPNAGQRPDTDDLLGLRVTTPLRGTGA